MGTRALLLVVLFATSAAAQPPSPPAARWQSSLAAAKTQAQQRRLPLLVRFGDEQCPWCRKLETELADAKLQKELQRWILVSLAPEAADKDAQTLGVSAIPALRILTPAGRLVARRDGFAPAAELLAWLQQQHEIAGAGPREELIAEGRPDAVAVVRLVATFAARDPVAREAAVRRLHEHPALAADPVLDALVKGPLQARLTALELLQAWQAPVAHLDPWDPDTLTTARLAALRQWASRPTPGATKLPADTGAELTRLLRADEVEALAVRERLARHGRALLPEVYQRLKDTTSDGARERLTALRYRLVARDALVLDWPGGIERLAGAAAGPRQQAVQELTARATAADEPLLLELFSSPDPLVRELSLRALKETAGAKAAGALLQLLSDPEPNVRAAVLKQLAVKPAKTLAPKLVEYVKGESDADLVVHAIRALREMKHPDATAGLKHLLQHPAWQVRAEAAEGLGHTVERHSNATEAQADVYATLLPVLDDADGFVVAKAIAGLRNADLAVAVEPLVRAAERHPDLMTEVVGVLASGDKMRRAALPHLRRFFGHDNPEVRAAALQGLGACVQADDTFITPGSPGAPIPARSIDAEIRAGLQDKSSVVRQAGAALVFNLLNQQRPSRHSSNASLWEPSTLSKFHNTGFTRPAWLTAYADLVQAQLAQEEPAERVQAALALVALGREKEGLPLLTQLGVKERELRHLTDTVLPWLEWEQRSDLFDRLLASEPEPGEYYTLLRSFAEVPDRRTIERLWAALAAGHGTEESATYFLQTLEQLYYGSTLNRYVNGQPQLAKEGRKEAAAAAVARVAKGPDMLRLVALLVLVRAAPDQVAAAARPVVEDRSAPAALRRDAFQLMLQGLGKEEKEQTAVAALGGDDEPLRLEALAMLAGGLDSFRGLREGKIYFSHTPYTSGYTGTQGSLPQVPRGLDAALLRPYLTGADPQNAARAGYLLALLKDPAGLDALLRQWRAHDKERAGMTELLYRAVASLGDDALVPVLEEIYRTYSPEEQQFNISDFYWTIRSIEGPAALRLRKQIRDDIGTENLR